MPAGDRPVNAPEEANATTRRLRLQRQRKLLCDEANFISFYHTSCKTLLEFCSLGTVQVPQTIAEIAGKYQKLVFHFSTRNEKHVWILQKPLNTFMDNAVVWVQKKIYHKTHTCISKSLPFCGNVLHSLAKVFIKSIYFRTVFQNICLKLMRNLFLQKFFASITFQELDKPGRK